MLVFPGSGPKAEAAEAKNGPTFRTSVIQVNVAGKPKDVNRFLNHPGGPRSRLGTGFGCTLVLRSDIEAVAQHPKKLKHRVTRGFKG